MANSGGFGKPTFEPAYPNTPAFLRPAAPIAIEAGCDAGAETVECVSK
jgi:hypothetical protein